MLPGSLNSSKSIEKVCFCGKDACYSCVFNNKTQYFCETCLNVYLDNSVSLENLSILNKDHNYESIKVVISSLVKIKTLTSAFRIQIFKNLSKIIKTLEQKVLQSCKSLENIEKQVDSIIKQLKFSPKNLKQSYLKDTIFLDENEAIIECNKWSLISMNLSTENVINAANNWISLTNNFTSILNPSIKPFEISLLVPSSNSQKLEKKESKSLVCNNNHSLTWSNYTIFQSFLQNRSYFIKCNQCLSAFSSFCWSCKECKFNLCPECGFLKGHVSGALKCDNKHELLWRCDVNIYYKNKGLGYQYSCRICYNIKLEPHWHCRKCDFDICVDCGSANLVKPNIILPKCTKFHPYEIKNSLNEGILPKKCNNCNNVFKGAYHFCKVCKVSECVVCTKSDGFPGHPIIHCHNYHILSWKGEKGFYCDFCKKSLTAERFTCKSCDFDACAECAEFLIDYISSGIRLCDQYGHGLSWVSFKIEENNNSKQCCICSNNFKRIGGMFSCNECNSYHCITCVSSWKPINKAYF